MVTWPKDRRIVPSILGVAMFAIVIAATVAPITTPVPAQTTCPYGQACPVSPVSNNLIYYEIAIGLAVVLLAAIAALILLRRRRGQGGAPPPLREFETPPGGPSAPPGAISPPPPPSSTMAAAGMTTAASAAYLEGPADIGSPPPSLPAGASGAEGATGEADIDSLMKELDRISGEILKKGPPKKPGDASGTTQGEGGGTAD